MESLSNWDDLIHGTAVFSAAVPFCTTLLLAWRFPNRCQSVAVTLSLAISFFWFFGVPKFPPGGSEDVAVWSLGVVLLLAVADLFPFNDPWDWLVNLVSRAAYWMGLTWLVYPAWLAESGGDWKKLGICVGVGLSIGIWALIVEYFFKAKGEGPPRISYAVFLPPTIALAVLLQLGGALRFSQSAGAVAATIGALCGYSLMKSVKEGGAGVASLWAMIFGIFAWSGWLFVEIHKVAALVLLIAPMLALGVRRLRLPRKNRFQEQLWDGLASASVSALAVWMAWSAYQEDNAGYEGY